MRTIARFMDARNTAEGKFLSVLLSVLLVFSFLNVTMFTDYANATDENGPEAQQLVDEAEDQTADAADDLKVEEPQGEVIETVVPGEDDSDEEGAQESDANKGVNEEPVSQEETSQSEQTPTEKETTAGASMTVVDEPNEVTTPQKARAAAPGGVTIDQCTKNNPYVVHPGQEITLSSSNSNYKKWRIAEGQTESNLYDWDDKIGLVSLYNNEKSSVSIKVANNAAEGYYTIRHKTGERRDNDTYEYFYIKVVGGDKLAINGENAVTAGSTLQLIADTNLNDVTWTTSDSSIATVDASGKVAGVKKGTVTITASVTGSDGKLLTATKEVTVNRDETKGYYVYVYTHVTADDPQDKEELGLTVNDQGWCTLGRLFVEGIEKPVSQDNTTTGENFQKVMEAMKDMASNFDPFGKNAAIDISAIDWKAQSTTSGISYGLKTSNGATDYQEESAGKKTWHLDGTVDVSKTGRVVFNYLDKETGKPIADKMTVSGKNGVDVDINGQIKTISGYTFASADPDSLTYQAKTTQTVNLYYVKGQIPYTVKYLEKDTGKMLVQDKRTAAAFGANVTETAVSLTGYTVAGANEQTITIQADQQQNIITFYYVKKTDLSYTVKYLQKDADNKEVAPAKTVGNQVFGAEVTEAAINIEGYESVAPTSATVKIQDVPYENVIIFYYTPRTDISYTVKYMERGTGKKLADSKIVKEQTFGSEVTENAIDINGYNKVEPTESTITLKAENNEIVFQYVKRSDLSYTVNYLKATKNPITEEVTKTTETIIDPKVTPDQTFGESILTQDEVVDLGNYGYVYELADPSLGITIGAVEGGKPEY